MSNPESFDWNTPIDAYCERLGPEFLAEPVNAFTNIAFLIATFLLLRNYYRSEVRRPLLCVTIIVVGAIGIGSFLFHTFATRWAALADVIPIMLSMLLLLILLLHGVFRLRWWVCLLLILGFFAAGPLAGMVIPFDMNGSEGYVPSLLTMCIAAIFTRTHAPILTHHLLLASVLLAASLTFRSVDMMVCDSFPLGTHFMWHVLNGAMFYVLLSGFIRYFAHAGQEASASTSTN